MTYCKHGRDIKNYCSLCRKELTQQIFEELIDVLMNYSHMPKSKLDPLKEKVERLKRL